MPDLISFGDIVKEKKSLSRFNPSYREMNLEEFSRYMQSNDPNRNDYSQGFDDNIVKRASVAVDQVIDLTPLPEIGSAVTGALGKPFGLEDFGAELGEQLPRGLAEVASQAGWFLGPPGWILASLGLASAAAGGYEKSGRIRDGVIDAVSTAATPFVGIGGRLVGAGIGAKTIGTKVAQNSTKRLATNAGQRAGQTIVERGTELAAQSALDAATNIAKGIDPTSPEAVFASAVTSVVDVAASAKAIKSAVDADGQPFATSAQEIQTKQLSKLLDAQKTAYDEAVNKNAIEEPETASPVVRSDNKIELEKTTAADVTTNAFPDVATNSLANANANPEASPASPLESSSGALNLAQGATPSKANASNPGASSQEVVQPKVELDQQSTANVEQSGSLEDAKINAIADTIIKSDAATVVDFIGDNQLLNQMADMLNKQYPDTSFFSSEVLDRFGLEPNGRFTSTSVQKIVDKLQLRYDEPLTKTLERIPDIIKDVARLAQADIRAEVKRKQARAKREEQGAATKQTLEEKLTSKQNLEDFNSAFLQLDQTNQNIFMDAYAQIGELPSVFAQDFATSSLQTNIVDFVKSGQKGNLQSILDKSLENATKSSQQKIAREKVSEVFEGTTLAVDFVQQATKPREQISPKQILINDWNQFAAKQFAGLGLDAQVQAAYIDIGQRVINTFSGVDRARIATLTNRQQLIEEAGRILGLNIPAGGYAKAVGTKSRVIGIIGEKMFGTKELDAFMRTSALAHEQFHALVDNLRAVKKPGKDTTERLAALARMEEVAKNLTPDERYNSAKFLTEYLVPERFRTIRGQDDPDLEGVYNVLRNDPEEYLAYYAQILAMSLATNRNARAKIQEMKGYVNPEEAAFVQGMFRTLSDVSEALDAWGKLPQTKQIVEDFKQLARTPKQLRDAQQKLLQMSEFLHPENVVDKLSGIESNLGTEPLSFEVSDILTNASLSNDGVKAFRTGLKKVKEIIKNDSFNSLKRQVGKKFPTLTSFIGNPLQYGWSVKDELPIVSQIVANVYDKNAKIKTALTSQNRVFLTQNFLGRLTTIENVRDSRLTPEQREQKTAMGLIAKDPVAAKAFDDIALQHNNEGTDISFENVKSDNWNKLNLEKKNLVWKMIGAVKTVNQQAARDLIKFGREQTAGVVGLIMMKKNGELSWDQAYREGLSGFDAAAKQFQLLPKAQQDILRGVVLEYTDTTGVKRFVAMPDGRAARQQMKKQLEAQGIDGRTIRERGGLDVTNKRHPELRVYHRQAVANLAAQLKASGMDKSLVNTVAESYASHVKLERTLSRGWFFSERRVGDYIIKYRRGGKEATEAAVKKSEAQDIVKRLQADPDVEKGSINWFKKSQQQSSSDLDYLNPTAIRVFAAAEEQAYQQAVAELDPDSVPPDYTPGEAVLKKWLDQRTKSFLRQQERKPGREYNNMWRAAIDYSNAVAYSIGNAHTRLIGELQLSDPTMKANPDIQRGLKDWLQNETQIQHKEFPLLRQGIFAYFLGFNPSSALVDASSSLLVTLPTIVQNVGGYREAGKIFTSSANILRKAYNAKGFMRAGKLKFDDPELQVLYTKAIDEDIISYGAYDDTLVTPQELSTVNARKVQAGGLPMTAKELVKNTGHLYLKSSRAMYSITTAMNGGISFISGYQIGKQKGLKGSQLYDFAKEFTRGTQFSGGKPNRPFGMRHFGKAQGAVAVMLSLSNYVTTAMHMHVRLFNDALREAKAQGLFKNLSEAGGSRKAFAAMFAAQATAAGALGMPFAGFMIKTLEEIFGKEIHASLREGISQLAGDDEELGSMLSDVALNGVPSAFLGVDVGSRLSLGSLFGLSAYEGFNVHGFMGAGGAIAENIYEGLGMAGRGEYDQAFKTMIPQAFKNITDLVQNEGAFRDRKGELLYEPSFGEQLAYATGFKPKKLSDLKLQQRLMRQADDNLTRERREDLSEIAEELLAGDVERARELVQTYAAQSLYTEEEVQRSVVDIALEKFLPRDFLDEGSKSSALRRQAIAQSFGSRLPRPSELVKKQEQKRLQTMLSGTPEQLSASEVLEASLIDAYIRQNPNTPRTVAITAVRQQLSLMGL